MSGHKKENAPCEVAASKRVSTQNPISIKANVSHIIAPTAAASLKPSRIDKRQLSPREVRTLKALIAGAVPRETLDRLAGAANSPGLIFQLRRRGFSIHCSHQPCKDRDGLKTHFGVYHLAEGSREKALGAVRGANGET